MKAVFDLSRSSISICRYFESVSHVQKILTAPKKSMQSSNLGRRYQSNTITGIRLR